MARPTSARSSPCSPAAWPRSRRRWSAREARTAWHSHAGGQTLYVTDTEYRTAVDLTRLGRRLEAWQDREVRISVSLMSSYPDTDARLGARMMIDRARVAAAAGLDGLYLGDHHGVPVPYYQQVPMLGRLLADWGDRPAGALWLLPLWNPVLAAEQAGTLAAIAEGPFVVQCGVGSGDTQFRAMGASLRTRGRELEHRLGVMTSLLRGETVDGVRISPTPGPRGFAVWIGGVAPAALDRAARLGDAWYGGPELDDTSAGALLADFRAACARYGRSPIASPLRRDVYVAADDRDADRVRAFVGERGHRGFPVEAIVIGTVSEVADRCRALAGFGFDEIVVRNLGVDQAAALASIERLADVRAAVLDA